MRIGGSYFWPLAATLLALAGCGGGAPSNSNTSVGGASGVAASGAPQPPDGVPAGTSPLPLPVAGQGYDNPQPRDSVKDGGTLTLPIAEIGPNFNHLSAGNSTGYLRHIYTWIAPRLWTFTVTGESAPDKNYLLSAEVIGTDPETVKYTLNPNAKWNDGTPIDWTTFDTLWKTQSGNDPRFNPASTDGFNAVGSVTKGDASNEVIVTFKTPVYPIESVFDELEHPRNADPEFYRTGWLNDIHPELLAGPFMVESLTEDRLVLARNPKWWGQTPKLDKVVYRLMDDLASVNAFQNGEVDSSTINGARATADTLKQLSGVQNAQIRRGFATVTSVYEMGRDSDLFKDPAARRAFALGTDRRLLSEIRFQGMGWEEEAPGSALIYPWQTGYRDNMPDLHFDPVQARAVLDAADWKVGDDNYRQKDGKLAEFNYVTFGDEPVFIAMARAQQKMAKDIGLKMNIDVRKSADFSTTLSSGTFDVVAMSWSADGPTGYSFAYQIYGSASESNFSRLGNEQLDERLRSVGTVRDSVAALRAFNDAEEEALHLYGVFPIYNGPSQYAVRKGLANFGPAGFKTPRAEDIGWQK